MSGGESNGTTGLSSLNVSAIRLRSHRTATMAQLFRVTKTDLIDPFDPFFVVPLQISK